MDFWAFVGVVLKIIIVVAVTQGAVAYLILVERKVAAFAQDRLGPNRCGREFGIPFGLAAIGGAFIDKHPSNPFGTWTDRRRRKPARSTRPHSSAPNSRIDCSRALRWNAK